VSSMVEFDELVVGMIIDLSSGRRVQVLYADGDIIRVFGQDTNRRVKLHRRTWEKHYQWDAQIAYVPTPHLDQSPEANPQELPEQIQDSQIMNHESDYPNWDDLDLKAMMVVLGRVEAKLDQLLTLREGDFVQGTGGGMVVRKVAGEVVRFNEK